MSVPRMSAAHEKVARFSRLAPRTRRRLVATIAAPGSRERHAQAAYQLRLVDYHADTIARLNAQATR